MQKRFHRIYAIDENAVTGMLVTMIIGMLVAMIIAMLVALIIGMLVATVVGMLVAIVTKMAVIMLRAATNATMSMSVVVQQQTHSVKIFMTKLTSMLIAL